MSDYHNNALAGLLILVGLLLAVALYLPQIQKVRVRSPVYVAETPKAQAVVPVEAIPPEVKAVWKSLKEVIYVARLIVSNVGQILPKHIGLPGSFLNQALVECLAVRDLPDPRLQKTSASAQSQLFENLRAYHKILEWILRLDQLPELQIAREEYTNLQLWRKKDREFSSKFDIWIEADNLWQLKRSVVEHEHAWTGIRSALLRLVDKSDELARKAQEQSSG